jgi:choline kinase
MNKAVYLLAGAGSRLRPLTDNTPKSLIEINGLPLLARSVDSMLACGVAEFVVVTGFLEDAIRRFFSERYPELPVSFIHNDRYHATNNAFSLRLASEAFTGEGMILLDGDILFDHRIAELVMSTPARGNHLAVRRSCELGEEEIKVMLDMHGEVERIGKKLLPEECFGESIGIAKFSPESTSELFAILDYRVDRLGLVNEFYEASFQDFIDGGGRIGIVDTGEYPCIEIDTLDDLQLAASTVAPCIDRAAPRPDAMLYAMAR